MIQKFSQEKIAKAKKCLCKGCRQQICLQREDAHELRSYKVMTDKMVRTGCIDVLSNGLADASKDKWTIAQAEEEINPAICEYHRSGEIRCI